MGVAEYRYEFKISELLEAKYGEFCNIKRKVDSYRESATPFIGSAQLRRGDAILQHGSMRLQPDYKLFYQVFGEEVMAVELLISQGREGLIEIAIEALSAAAARCFDVEFVVEPLSEQEWESIFN